MARRTVEKKKKRAAGRFAAVDALMPMLATMIGVVIVLRITDVRSRL